jgi:hypothetical protein
MKKAKFDARIIIGGAYVIELFNQVKSTSIASKLIMSLYPSTYDKSDYPQLSAAQTFVAPYGS